MTSIDQNQRDQASMAISLAAANGNFQGAAEPLGTGDPSDRKLSDLMYRINRAARFRKPFTLRTAEEIGLYLDHTTKAVFNLAATSRMPFHNEGAKLCLRLDAYERYIALQQWCSMNVIDFDKHARDWGFPKPDEITSEREPSRRRSTR
jgi:hypothetical protein